MADIGHVWRAKPGKADEYRRVHATVWPELEQVLRDAGVTKCVIYGWGDLFFMHTEVADYEAMVERYNNDPIAQRWEQQMAGLIEYVDADPNTGWPKELDKVWFLGR